MVHQHLTHGPGRNAQEVGTVPGRQPCGCRQLHVRLVHQGRGVQGVIEAFPTELTPCDVLEVGVYQGDETVHRDPVTVPGLVQQLGDLP
jgi:hypothetical protein